MEDSRKTKQKNPSVGFVWPIACVFSLVKRYAMSRLSKASDNRRETFPLILAITLLFFFVLSNFFGISIEPYFKSWISFYWLLVRFSLQSQLGILMASDCNSERTELSVRKWGSIKFSVLVEWCFHSEFVLTGWVVWNVDENKKYDHPGMDVKQREELGMVPVLLLELLGTFPYWIMPRKDHYTLSLIGNLYHTS